VKPRRVHPSAAPSAPARKAGRSRQIALRALVLAGLVGGVAFGLRHRQRDRIRAELPAVPLNIASPALHELIAQARRDAVTPAGIAELARLYHANGLLPEAAACWRILQRDQPPHARRAYYLADLARSEGDYAAAEQYLEKTVALDPRYAPAWLRLAEMKFKSGRLDAAAHDYARRLELLPGDPYAELGLARVAQQQKRPEETRQRLERLLAANPKFSAAQNLYAELLAADGREDLADYHRWLGREAGRFREADDAWLEELNRWCHDARQLCHLGTIAFQTNHGDRGRGFFERAIAEDPRDPLGYQLLGELLLRDGEAVMANEILQRGLTAGGTASPAHYVTLSQAAEKLGAPDQAMKVLTEGLGRHPDSAELHHALGALLARLRQTSDAIVAYRRALTLNPALAEADFNLALALLETGRRDEAVAALKHSLEAQPGFPKARLLLGRMAMDTGRLEEAGEYLRPLLKANPGVPEIRQIVAQWCLQMGASALARQDVRSAIDHFGAGLVLQPENANLNANLGVQLLKIGQAADAIPLLEKFRQLQPQDPRGGLFLGQAYARTGRIAEARKVLEDALPQAERAGDGAVAGACRESLAALPR
jgi:HemY protein